MRDAWNNFVFLSDFYIYANVWINVRFEYVQEIKWNKAKESTLCDKLLRSFWVWRPENKGKLWNSHKAGDASVIHMIFMNENLVEISPLFSYSKWVTRNALLKITCHSFEGQIISKHCFQNLKLNLELIKNGKMENLKNATFANIFKSSVIIFIPLYSSGCCVVEMITGKYFWNDMWKLYQCVL